MCLCLQGLGKTVQTIAYIAALQCVPPFSLLYDCCTTLQKHVGLGCSSFC